MVPEAILSRSFLSSSVIKILLTLNASSRAVNGPWILDMLPGEVKWGKGGMRKKLQRNAKGIIRLT